MYDLKKSRKTKNVIFMILVIVLLLALLSTNFIFVFALSTKSKNICDSIVVKTGTVELLVTDQDGNRVEPMQFPTIDTGYKYLSDSYIVRVTNIGTLPIKFEISTKNVVGDEELINNFVLRGEKKDAFEDKDTVVGRGALMEDLILAECKYLDVGETREFNFQAAIPKNPNLEHKECSYDIHIRGLQTIHKD